MTSIVKASAPVAPPASSEVDMDLTPPVRTAALSGPAATIALASLALEEAGGRAEEVAQRERRLQRRTERAALGDRKKALIRSLVTTVAKTAVEVASSATSCVAASGASAERGPTGAATQGASAQSVPVDGAAGQVSVGASTQSASDAAAGAPSIRTCTETQRRVTTGLDIARAVSEVPTVSVAFAEQAADRKEHDAELARDRADAAATMADRQERLTERAIQHLDAVVRAQHEARMASLRG